MTAAHERLMTTGEFEALARAADHIGEGVELEFIGGQLAAKARPDGNHSRIIQWLIRMFLSDRPEVFLTPRVGIQVGSSRTDRARPDAVLAASHAFAGQGEWSDPSPVLLAVEITSNDQNTEYRDHRDKPHAYAATGIPVYLLIDRRLGEMTTFSEPTPRRYGRRVTVPIGCTLTLPDPVDVEMDTEPLKNWVR
ncbi:Uma2 family endonuclease [Nocardia sp. NPDC048505]|uniref:Uma2 family endonuclease n=1 Tax=unclassified Nocardia TaxID=2637762 RepID=UPI00340C7A86